MCCKPIALAATGPETQALGDRLAHMCGVNPGYNLKEEQGQRGKASVSHSCCCRNLRLIRTSSNHSVGLRKGLVTVW